MPRLESVRDLKLVTQTYLFYPSKEAKTPLAQQWILIGIDKNGLFLFACDVASPIHDEKNIIKLTAQQVLDTITTYTYLLG